MTALNHLTISQLAHQFQDNGQRHFTGEFCARSPNGETWSLYFRLGRLIWATASYHRFRRWRRALTQFCPGIHPDSLQPREGEFSPLWEYGVLMVLVKRQRIDREQAVALIEQTAVDVLFDILQDAESYRQSTQVSERIKTLGDPITILNAGQLLQKAHALWKDWCEAELARYSPHLAPFLRQPDELRQRISEKTYQMLERRVNGQTTLADLAVAMKQDTLTVARSLAPYLDKGLMGFQHIPDWLIVENQLESEAQAIVEIKPTIVCIDDSPQVCRIMERILSAAGYQVVSVQDSLQALPTLLEAKPSLIFLDLVMPVASGYEICAQIRRVSTFHNTPVVILTGNDGIVDRVRAKIVGASEFLPKPIEPEKVLGVTRRYAPIQSTSNPLMSAPASSDGVEENTTFLMR